MLITPTHSEHTAVRGALAGRLAEGRLELTQCGMGMAAAAALCQRLEGSGWTGSMVLLGWAGGLSPDLAAGDYVVADAALDAQGHCVSLGAPDVSGAIVGPLLCVDTPLATPQAKHDAWRSGALAVEMEAYPLAVWAAARAIPFIHARVILDTVDEALPDLGDALDAQGRVRPVRLAAWLAARPRTALSLLWLARRVRALDWALGALARAVVALAPE